MSEDNPRTAVITYIPPTPPDVARNLARRIRAIAPDWPDLLAAMGLEEAL